MNNNKKGFTLIELMITVAIIGVLSAVAIPAYQDYTIRSQVTEGLSLASGAKVSVYEYYANNGSYPTSNQQLGYMGGEGKYVSRVDIGEGGIIVATFGDEANEKLSGKKVLLSPSLSFTGPIAYSSPTIFSKLTSILFFSNDAIAQELEPGWGCFGNIPQKYLPSTCISVAINEDNTVTPIDPTNPSDPEAPTEPNNPNPGGSSGETNPPVEPEPEIPSNPYEQREDFSYSSGVTINKNGTLTEANGTVRQPTGINPDGSISYAFNKLYPDGLLVKSTGYFLTIAQKAAYPDLQTKYNSYKQMESNYNNAAPGSAKNNFLAALKTQYKALEDAKKLYGTNVPLDYPSLPTKY